MALRDQPYIPLYIQDFLTDEKLLMCSASAHGVYIRLMCIMHKSDEYGTILLRQKEQQSKSVCCNFACKLAKMMPFSFECIKEALNELVEEGVLSLDGYKLLQKRMIHDNELSLKRSNAGSKGGFATANKSAKCLAKVVANPESENEYDNANENKTLFSKLWKELICSQGRQRAFKFFLRDYKTEEYLINISKAIENYNKSKNVRQRFIMDGGKFFNTEYHDWVEMPVNQIFCEKCQGKGEYMAYGDVGSTMVKCDCCK